MGEQVDALAPGMTGRWLVTTQGTIHLWDLDEMTYERRPGPSTQAGSMLGDGSPQPITRVESWPIVGACSLVWFDRPGDWLIEEYRISSTVVSIERVDGETS